MYLGIKFIWRKGWPDYNYVINKETARSFSSKEILDPNIFSPKENTFPETISGLFKQIAIIFHYCSDHVNSSQQHYT